MSRGDRIENVRSLANQAWTEMQQHGVLPTPRNFELWFTYLDNTDPELSRRISALLAAETSLTPEQMQALYSQRISREIDSGTIADQAEQLDGAAQSLVDEVTSGQLSLATYGRALADLMDEITKDRTVGGLLRVVSSLAAETTRAGDRNRLLEQRLSGSVARIRKLRDELGEARQEATTDVLTGLRNRRAFDARLRGAIRTAQAGGLSVCVAILDIDHFKRFNDDYGHQTGDLVLRLVAGLIAENVKGRDTAARYGGEEFALILVGANLQAGIAVAGQIRAVLDGKHLVAKGTARRRGMVTLSGGVAQLRAGDSIAELIDRADAALYEAKRLGRNQVCGELT